MDLIKENVNQLRDSVQRNTFSEITVIDIFTAFYVILGKRIDYGITDDKYFKFLLGSLRHHDTDISRKLWYDTMFRTYEKLSEMPDVNDSNWLLLQANLVYLAPIICN